MAEITRIRHWMLGEATVEPPVQVVNTQFYNWEPDEEGVYPAQALHYSIMHPRVMAQDNDIRGEDPHSSVRANNRSILWTYGVADGAARNNVIDSSGSPYGPIPVDQVEEEIDYQALGLRIDTATLREQLATFYKEIGGITLSWAGEPPLIEMPLPNGYFFPNGSPAQPRV